MEAAGVAENTQQLVDGWNKYPLARLESFQQHLQSYLDQQQQTLGELQTELAEMLNRSTQEMEHFHCGLPPAQMTSTPKESSKIRDPILSSLASSFAPLPITNSMNAREMDINKHKAIAVQAIRFDNHRNASEETYEFPFKARSECFSPAQSSDSSSISDYTFTVYENVQKNSEIDDFKKQDAHTQTVNDMEDLDSGSLRVSDFDINENKGAMRSETPYTNNLGGQIQESLSMTRRPASFNYDQITESTLKNITNPKIAFERENTDKPFKTSQEEATTRANAADMEHLYKIHNVHKSLLSKAEQTAIQEQHISQVNQTIQRALKQLHTNAQVLMAENLQCREQIANLRREERFLQLRLSKAEQDAEEYLQQVKVMTQKCEDLLNQRKELQVERNHLDVEKCILTKELEGLKNENKQCLMDLLMATTEKSGLEQQLDYSKRMMISNTKEKQALQSKLTKAVMENYHLRRKSEENGSQYLKETRRMMMLRNIQNDSGYTDAWGD